MQKIEIKLKLITILLIQNLNKLILVKDDIVDI